MENKAENIKEGKYIYCIIRHTGPIEFDSVGVGTRGDRVYAINYKDICAVVSNSPVIQYEARRVNMMAHQKVLEDVMKQFTILPVRFSTISESNDESKILKILEKDYVKFSDLLERMDGKKELGLKTMALEEPIFKYILDKYDDIRKLKEILSKLPPDKAHYQLIKIGDMVENALRKENLLFHDIILNALNPLAEEVKINDKYGERMIINAAFLIKNEKEPEFDKAINELDNQYSNLMSFKYAGTLPPYNFVNLVINTKEI